MFAAFSGYVILRLILNQIGGDERIAYAGIASGLIIAFAAIVFEERVKKTPLRVVAGGAIGLIIGLIVANLLTYPLVLHFFNNAYIEFSAYIFTNCVIGYLGLTIGMRKGDEFDVGVFGGVSGTAEEEGPPLVVDTSVIIDGRIADICGTGFVEGTLTVAQFVLGELQHIADSSDPVKRARGKRGLDVLKRIQESGEVNVQITDRDFPKIKEVDMKLVALARELGGKVLTNDVNLNKVADLQGVKVLNINTLASALKPVVLPGELMEMLVLKEGREEGQGVGYLDDGTMVVVDNGRECVGKTVTVEITSILQTAGGRMVFSKLREGPRPPVRLHVT
ncbi:MAG: PIN domain-containing protein [Thermodesulfobacteriota bacterium]